MASTLFEKKIQEAKEEIDKLQLDKINQIDYVFRNWDAEKAELYKALLIPRTKQGELSLEIPAESEWNASVDRVRELTEKQNQILKELARRAKSLQTISSNLDEFRANLKDYSKSSQDLQQVKSTNKVLKQNLEIIKILDREAESLIQLITYRVANELRWTNAASHPKSQEVYKQLRELLGAGDYRREDEKQMPTEHSLLQRELEARDALTTKIAKLNKSTDPAAAAGAVVAALTTAGELIRQIP